MDSDMLNSVLFRALYEEGKNLSDVGTLIDIVESTDNKFGSSINLQELREYLEENAGATIVRQEMEQTKRQHKIRGVPYFIIHDPKNQQPYQLSGAQPSSTFEEIFAEIRS